MGGGSGAAQGGIGSGGACTLMIRARGGEAVATVGARRCQGTEQSEFDGADLVIMFAVLRRRVLCFETGGVESVHSDGNEDVLRS
jgi:hypothetical protein